MFRKNVMHKRRMRLPGPLVTRKYGLNKRHDRRQAALDLGIFSLDSLFGAYHSLKLLIGLQ